MREREGEGAREVGEREQERWGRERVCRVGTSSWNGAVDSRFICAGDSNWRDWDPGADAGQTERLSPSAGGIHIVLVNINISSGVPPSFSAREGSRMRPLALLALLRVLCASVSVDLYDWPCIFTYIFIYICVFYLHMPTGNICSTSLLVASWAWNCTTFALFRLSELT